EVIRSDFPEPGGPVTQTRTGMAPLTTRTSPQARLEPSRTDPIEVGPQHARWPALGQQEPVGCARRRRRNP
ncbi:MAG: hypothetical protein WEA81_00950, partial [Dehalococcoidia bacterium]